MTINELYKQCKKQIGEGLGDCEIDGTGAYLLFIIGYDFTKELEAECSRRQGIDDAPCDLAFDIAQEIIEEYNQFLNDMNDMAFDENVDIGYFIWDYEDFYDFVQEYFEAKGDI